MTPALLRRDAAAEYVGVSGTTLDTLRDLPDFPRPVWIDTWPRWARADLDAWVATLARAAHHPDKPAPTPVRHRRSKHDRPLEVAS